MSITIIPNYEYNYLVFIKSPQQIVSVKEKSESEITRISDRCRFQWTHNNNVYVFHCNSFNLNGFYFPSQQYKYFFSAAKFH